MKNTKKSVNVNVENELNDVKIPRIGVNCDYFMDAQGNRPEGSKSMVDAYKALGVKIVRFPGGNKADNYLWSIPPYDKPNPQLARISKQDWPSAEVVGEGHGAAFWYPEGDVNGTWSRPVYDFDQYISDCRSAGAEPNIVVAYGGIYKPPYPGGVSLTWQQALDTAVSWVKYANIHKGYNIRYWSIGNESWMENNGFTQNPGAMQYGKDAAVFAQAMKAVDPTIMIGINGDTTAWFDEVLEQCLPYIDYLDVHGYPLWVMGKESTYDTYVDLEVNPITYVDMAQQSIDKLPEVDRKRLFITFSETGGLAYGSWDDSGATTGKGIAIFDIFSKLVCDSRVLFSQFWNTRYIWNNDQKPSTCDVLNTDNTLNAQGVALSVLSGNLSDKMVETSGSVIVKSLASLNKESGELNVFLLNKAKISMELEVSLQGYSSAETVGRWIYKGKDENDYHPEYKRFSDLSVNKNNVDILLDPVSITVLKFNRIKS